MNTSSENPSESLGEKPDPVFRLALTPGEPAGIGPDLCAQLAQSPPPGVELIVFCDPELPEQRAAALDLPLRLDPPGADPRPCARGELRTAPVKLAAPARPGVSGRRLSARPGMFREIGENRIHAFSQRSAAQRMLRRSKS